MLKTFWVVAGLSVLVFATLHKAHIELSGWDVLLYALAINAVVWPFFWEAS